MMHAIFNLISTIFVYETNLILVGGYLIALIAAFIWSRKEKEA